MNYQLHNNRFEALLLLREQAQNHKIERLRAALNRLTQLNDDYEKRHGQPNNQS